MIQGLLAAADAWDDTGAQLDAVAAALGAELRSLGDRWAGRAAAAVASDLAKVERAAARGSETFHSYASDLRSVANYLAKVRHIKEELRNLWKLI